MLLEEMADDLDDFDSDEEDEPHKKAASEIPDVSDGGTPSGEAGRRWQEIG